VDQRSDDAGSAQSDRHRWHQAAEHARFRFFEPVGPGRTSVWAGGFGWDRDEPSHLEVLASIDGVEIQVDTTLSSPRSHRDSRKRLVLDLLFNYVLHDGAELVLPMSIEVVADDRVISVAGQDLLFSGMRIATCERWTGEVEHDGVVIRAVTSTYAPAFSIEVCSDWRSMADFPPRAS